PDGEHAGQAVDELAAIGGAQAHAIGLGHDEGVLGELLHLHEVEDEVADVGASGTVSIGTRGRVDHLRPSLMRWVVCRWRCSPVSLVDRVYGASLWHATR